MNFQRNTMPEKFPAPVELRHPNGNVGFRVDSKEAYAAFYANLRAFDRGGLMQAVAAAADKTLDIKGLRSAIREGIEWREPFMLRTDGSKKPCGFCGSEFQPFLGPEFQRGEHTFRGGSVLVIKRHLLEDILAEKLGEARKGLAAAVVGSALGFTAEVMGEAETPDMALAILACNLCKEMIRSSSLGSKSTAVSIADAKSAIQVADERIGTADLRSALQEAFGGRRDDGRHRRNTGGGVHAGQPPNGSRFRYDRRNSDDQRSDSRPKVNWCATGAMYFVDTAAALSAAGYTTLEQLVAEEQQLPTKANLSLGSAGAVVMIARRVLHQRSQEVSRPRETGSAVGAVVAPGAEAPVSAKTKRRKTLTVTVDAAPKKGGDSNKKKGKPGRSGGSGLAETLGD